MTIPLIAAPRDGADTGDYTAPAEVVFNAGETTKDVTVTAADDDEDDDSESVELVFGRLPAGVSEGATTRAMVRITDNDGRGIDLSRTSLTVSEGGSATYTVALASRPTTSVTVTITGHLGTDLSLDRTSLFFTASTWNTAQVVMVSAARDLDATNDSATLTHTASGVGYGSVTAAVTVTVVDGNKPPAVTGAVTFTYRENGTAALHTFRATDPERSAITWSLLGPDEDDFAISETGVLSFANPPDYESPADSGSDNVYEVTLVAQDDAFNSGTLNVTVTVTDQNEAPEISGQQSLSFTENQVTDRVLATYTAADPEAPGAVITRWSLTGRDAGDFAIDENGQLTFRNVPDYEKPADSGRDNVYNLSVRASDGRYYGYLEVTVTVTVEDVNEPPTITTASKTAFSYRENGTATLYTFRATDPERSSIEWSLSGPDDDHFAINETGVLAFANPPDYESPADSGRDNVYEVTVMARDDASNTSPLAVTVTVTDQNEGPEISGQQSLSFTENQITDRVLATYAATDPEDPGASITRWSLTGTDAGDFTIDENGQLTFRNVPDHERPADSGRDNVYNFSVRASDGRNYGYLEVTVTVEDVNEAPTITTTSKTAFSYRENGTAALYTFGPRTPNAAPSLGRCWDRTKTTSPSARRAFWRSPIPRTTRAPPTPAVTTSTMLRWWLKTTPSTPARWTWR